MSFVFVSGFTSPMLSLNSRRCFLTNFTAETRYDKDVLEYEDIIIFGRNPAAKMGA
jgi:hypothetical protein